MRYMAHNYMNKECYHRTWKGALLSLWIARDTLPKLTAMHPLKWWFFAMFCGFSVWSRIVLFARKSADRVARKSAKKRLWLLWGRYPPSGSITKGGMYR